ncbi:MAG: Cu(I)-responsive transcriptional regulator [Gammaproteobacteria bacterium]|nr:Cu(I)-responsive transcriptional regulator [Gammaproteobacteria bacterium]
MNIGQAAQASGVSAKMIRHYESIGLIARADRTGSGYRIYSSTDLHLLTFIKQARNLGFSIDQIRELLNLWQNKRRSSRKVKELATSHIQELDERIRELQDIRQALSHLARHCHGDDRPECPILDGLANGHYRQAQNPKKKIGGRT